MENPQLVPKLVAMMNKLWSCYEVGSLVDPAVCAN